MSVCMFEWEFSQKSIRKICRDKAEVGEKEKQMKKEKIIRIGVN